MQNTAIELSDHELNTVAGGTGELLSDLKQYVSDSLNEVIKSLPSVDIPNSPITISCPPVDFSDGIKIS